MSRYARSKSRGRDNTGESCDFARPSERARNVYRAARSLPRRSKTTGKRFGDFRATESNVRRIFSDYVHLVRRGNYGLKKSRGLSLHRMTLIEPFHSRVTRTIVCSLFIRRWRRFSSVCFCRRKSRRPNSRVVLCSAL